MDAMGWSGLKVVAAEGVKQIGIVVDLPIVRRADGYIFCVEHVGVENPTPDSRVGEEELQNLIRWGHWLPAGEIPAHRDYLTVVESDEFLHIAEVLKIQLLPRRQRNFAYEHFEKVESWFDNTADALFDRSMHWSRDYWGFKKEYPDVKKHPRIYIDNVIRQVRFITDRGSDRRKRMYAYLLAFVHNQQRALEDLARREFQVSPEQLESLLAPYGDELKRNRIKS